MEFDSQQQIPMKVECFQPFKPKSSIEMSDDFANCLIHQKKKTSVLYDYSSNDSIELDAIYGTKVIPGTEPNEVWLESNSLRLFDLEKKEFTKELKYPLEGAFFRHASSSGKHVASSKDGIIWIQETSTGRLIREDLCSHESALKLHDDCLIEIPMNMGSRSQNYFRKLPLENTEELCREVAFDQHGGYKLLGIIGANPVYQCLNTDDLLFYDVQGKVEGRVPFKKVKSSAMYYHIDECQIYTVSKEGRFCYIRTFDEHGNLKAEHKLKFDTDIFKRNRYDSTIIPTLKYKDVLWIKNAAFSLEGDAYELGFPDDFDWGSENRIYKNGAFLIGTDYSERSNRHRSYVLGAFEPGVIHPEFPNHSEIEAI